MEQFSKYCKKKNVSVPLSIPILNISGEWKHALNFVNLLLVRTVSLKCTSSTWGMFFEKMRLFLLKRNSVHRQLKWPMLCFGTMEHVRVASPVQHHLNCNLWPTQNPHQKCNIRLDLELKFFSVLFSINKKKYLCFKKHFLSAWCVFQGNHSHR